MKFDLDHTQFSNDLFSETVKGFWVDAANEWGFTHSFMKVTSRHSFTLFHLFL